MKIGRKQVDQLQNGFPGEGPAGQDTYAESAFNRADAWIYERKRELKAAWKDGED